MRSQLHRVESYELALVLGRVRMADVEQKLSLHRAIRNDARRDALAETLP